MKKRESGSKAAPMAKIEPNPKLPKAFKGKAAKEPKSGRAGPRPAGGGKKGY